MYRRGQRSTWSSSSAASGVYKRHTQCSEVKIHACILREWPDVMSVVHVHPRYTVLMTVLEERLRPMAQEGAQLVLNELPVYPHTKTCLLYTSPIPRDATLSRMPSSA